MRLDVLVFGGGAAGLWCLDRLRRAGYHAVLLESQALGSGQTIQAQGIIHGGGKYALRGVRDFDAVRSTSAMPELWRRCLAGDSAPDLSNAEIVSPQCYLWLPRHASMARLKSLGFSAVIANTSLLATRPENISKTDWPAALRDDALAVYSLAEPVVNTGSVLRALAARNEKFIFRYDGAALGFIGAEVRVGDVSIRPRAKVLAAGAGNGALLGKVGMNPELMQRRPLGMVLLRGALPPLFGHCVVGGKTGLTITTPVAGIWQVGGEIAERLAAESDGAVARSAALAEIRRWLPHVNLSGVKIAIYRAMRAEARTAASSRPSGVHAHRVAPGLVVAWPTKLSMVPVLADEIFAIVNDDLKEPAGSDETPPWPAPTIARYPWEDAEWFAVN
jgi:glycine/D-amino acid oxidase-like deaminating enzyme